MIFVLIWQVLKKIKHELSQIGISFVYSLDSTEMKIHTFNQKIGILRAELLAVARTMTHVEAEAEDDVQETLLRLWRMGDRLDTHPHVWALAVSVLRNIRRDKWRHEQYEAAFVAEQCRNGLRSESFDDETELVSRILETLPPLQSQIFRMKEIDGYESAEIIQILGCTEENLRQNLSRARKRIREIYLKVNQR